MSKLKLLIAVSPYFYDPALNKEYRQATWEIREFLHLSMVSYLSGEAFRYEGGSLVNIKSDPRGMKNLISESQIRRVGEQYLTSLTINSDHSSFVEFGTGLFGELSSPHMIETKSYQGWGKTTKSEAMHWSDSSGEHFFSKIKGQYPKPFMRTAISKLQAEYNLIDGYEIFMNIIWPVKANFSTHIVGEMDKVVDADAGVSVVEETAKEGL